MIEPIPPKIGPCCQLTSISLNICGGLLAQEGTPAIEVAEERVPPLDVSQEIGRESMFGSTGVEGIHAVKDAS